MRERNLNAEPGGQGPSVITVQDGRPRVRQFRTRQSVVVVTSALLPALPVTLGALAFATLFWVGHLGVKDAIEDTNHLADAEVQSALAVSAGDTSVFVPRAAELLQSAGAADLASEVAALVSNTGVSDEQRLNTLERLFSARRTSRQHQAEQRFLALAAVGVGLALAGAVSAFWLWRRRWAGRWVRVGRLSEQFEALARAPLDVRFTASGNRDEIGRVEEALARVAPQLADTLVHQQRLSLLGEQVAFVAHDIRSPLASISLGLSLISEEALDAETRDILISESGRARALADELRDFARRTDTVRPCDLAVELEATVRLLRHRANERGVNIGREAPVPVVVLARGNEIRQVLVNLLENAVDAAAGSPRRQVIAAVAFEDGRAILRIEDSGAGVPPEQRSRLFASFYTNKEGGSGMGLAITRRIVESLGGSIGVHTSHALGGASFAVELPPVKSCAAQGAEDGVADAT